MVATAITTFALTPGSLVDKVVAALVIPFGAILLWLMLVLLWHVGRAPSDIHREQLTLLTKYEARLEKVDVEIKRKCWTMAGKLNLLVLEIRNNGRTGMFSAECQIDAYRNAKSAQPQMFIDCRFDVPWRHYDQQSVQILRGRSAELLLASINRIQDNEGDIDLWRYSRHQMANYLRDGWRDGPEGDKPEWDVTIRVFQDDPELLEPFVAKFVVKLRPGRDYIFEDER